MSHLNEALSNIQDILNPHKGTGDMGKGTFVERLLSSHPPSDRRSRTASDSGGLAVLAVLAEICWRFPGKSLTAAERSTNDSCLVRHQSRTSVPVGESFTTA